MVWTQFVAKNWCGLCLRLQGGDSRGIGALCHRATDRLLLDATAIAQRWSAARQTYSRRRYGGGAGSVQRAADNPLNVEFGITDFQSTVPVTYQGILPDLVCWKLQVSSPRVNPRWVRLSLAKRIGQARWNYMPPEVAKSMKENNRNGVVPHFNI